MTNHPTGDAFGRLRVSQPYTIWESKLLDGDGGFLWREELGIYATGTKNNEKSHYELTVSSTGDYAIRQTLQRFNYQAGKSQLALLTGKMSIDANTTQCVGLADVNHATHAAPYEIYNGMYFALDNGGHRWNDGLNVVITNNGVDNAVIQSDWNLDKLDGNGPSNKTLDINKVQIFVIDYEWLGVGRVRFGFNIDGVTYYCHEFNHANIKTEVYTRSPNLPIRYEIRSYGDPGQLNQICSSVMSEGGRQPSGNFKTIPLPYFDLSSNGTFQSATDHTAILAIRHQPLKVYSFVQLVKQVIETLGANNMRYSVSLVPPNTQINIGGSTLTALNDLSFTALADTSLEYHMFNTNGSDGIANSQILDYIIEEDFISEATGGASASTSSSQSNLVTLGEDIDGGKWCFLYTVQSYGTNDMRGTVKISDVL